MSVKEITAHLSSTGFSSPPAWLRARAVLSTGQKFRADLARLLAAPTPGVPSYLIQRHHFLLCLSTYW
ncbi:MAG TPA: hypothetical protein VGZ47_04195 [Gemmataceae bacterium]|nr:hypothetical protein [Gemmataceae bacterium]